MSVDEKLKSQLSAINLSIDELESQLDILLSQPFSETLGKLEKLQQAKVQTALPYLIYDLVFMYLKTKGVDPKNHPVINELARIKQYFDKISGAEKNLNAKEDSQHVPLDKAAASRFITHAIAQVKYNSSRPDEAGPSTQIIPTKITSKMLEREQYEKELREHMDDENEMDDIPQIFDDVEMEGDNDIGDRTGKGKARAKDVSKSNSKSKRKHSKDQDALGTSPPRKKKSTLLSDGPPTKEKTKPRSKAGKKRVLT